MEKSFQKWLSKKHCLFLPSFPVSVRKNSLILSNANCNVGAWNYDSRFVSYKARRDCQKMKRLDFWCDLTQLSNSQSHQSFSKYKRDIWSDCHGGSLMKCYKDFDTSHYPLFTHSRQKPTGKLSEITHGLTALSRLHMIKISEKCPFECGGIACVLLLPFATTPFLSVLHITTATFDLAAERIWLHNEWFFKNNIHTGYLPISYYSWLHHVKTISNVTDYMHGNINVGKRIKNSYR